MPRPAACLFGAFALTFSVPAQHPLPAADDHARDVYRQRMAEAGR